VRSYAAIVTPPVQTQPSRRRLALEIEVSANPVLRELGRSFVRHGYQEAGLLYRWDLGFIAEIE